MKDYLADLANPFSFALFISVPACYYGMNVEEGTRGVGVATTKSRCYQFHFYFSR